MGSVAEVEAAKRRLEAAGVEVVGNVGHDVIKSIYFFDPNGLRLEMACRTEAPDFLQHAALDAWSRQKSHRAKAYAGRQIALAANPVMTLVRAGAERCLSPRDTWNRMDQFTRPKPTFRLAPTDFTPGQIAVLFAVLMLLITIPLWTHRVPPLSDYINHLARMHVIANIDRDPNLARFYRIEWQIIPNLMMDVIVPVLARVMNIYAAGQVYMVMAFAIIGSGVLVLHRALFGRWSVLPLLAIPLLYNHVFLVGVVNYIFGIGLALWALAAWIALSDRSALLRAGVAAVFVVALFFCHLFALGIFGIGALSHEIERIWRNPRTPLSVLLARAATGACAFLPAVPLLLASPTMGLATESYWEPRGKIDGVFYIIEVYYDVVAFALTGLLAVAAGWASRDRLLRVHRLALVVLVVGTVVYMAMPRILFASYMADQRLPVAIAFMLLACFDLEMRTQFVRRAFIAVLLTSIVLRLCEVSIAWADLSLVTGEFRSSAKRIRPGSKVVVAYADTGGGDDVRDLGLVHAACLAIIERSSIVTTAFTVPGKQILRVLPEFADLVDTQDGTPPTVSQLLATAGGTNVDPRFYWRQWPDRFDYLYVLFTDTDSVNPDPKRLRIVQEGDRFQLYRIIRDTP